MALTVKSKRRGLVGGGGAWRKQRERWDGFETEERRREDEMFVRACWCSEWKTRGDGLERSIFAISRERTREVSLQLVYLGGVGYLLFTHLEQRRVQELHDAVKNLYNFVCRTVQNRASTKTQNAVTRTAVNPQKEAQRN